MAEAAETKKRVKKAAKAAEQETAIPAELTVEEAFAQLQELLGQMEDADVSLETSFALYERGMKLLAHCNARIDRVEKQVQKISEQGTLEPFE